MSKIDSSFSTNLVQQKYDDMILCIDKTRALVDIAVATPFSGLHETTIFHYFLVLSDMIENTRELANAINKN